MAFPNLIITAVLTLSLAAGVCAEEKHQDHSRYRNPPDLERYISLLMDPERDAWQQPARVIEALGLNAGDTVCDIGAGPGYFTLRLARAVGGSGRVYAVDVEPRILAELRDNLDKAGIRNVTPVLGRAADPQLPADVCDVILIVNTYHHFPDPPAYLRRLKYALARDGVVVNIDFREEADFGPPPAHRIARREFLNQAREAGYRQEGEEGFLPQQYFIVLRPASKPRP